MSESKEYHKKREDIKKLEIELRDSIRELEVKNTELKNYNEELEKTIIILNEAEKAAKKSDKMKSIFLANMSHEIRTPMNSIIGFSELLLNNGFNKRQTKKYLNIINKNSEQLLKLINDIIDLSKIEVGELRLDKSLFNIDNFMEEIYDSFSVNNNIIKKNLKLMYDISEECDECNILSDKTRLKQVMDNLISNSIKFTESGFIEYGCGLINENEMNFYVKDTGIGLTKEDQSEIFGRFIQADTKEHSKKEGTGLGLSISKGIVELMGGKIKIKSDIGKGSEFSFIIPVERSNKKPTNNKRIIDEKYNFHDIKILVAEDIEDNFSLIEEILIPTQCDIDWAKNGIETIDLYKKNIYDMILLDMRMPLMCGFEVIDKIRKHNKKIPIIAQTAYALANDKEKLLSSGCTDYISKPINRQELLNIISKHV